MSLRREKDLLPWILGGVLGIAGASAAVISLTPSPKSVVAAAPTLPAAVAATMPVVAVAISKSKPVGLPVGQVYQCTVNGELTFSDSPCGSKAVVRQLSAVNTMTPTNAAFNQTYLSTPPTDYGTNPYEGASTTEERNVYITEEINIIDRRRREHRAHEHHHGTELRR